MPTGIESHGCQPSIGRACYDWGGQGLEPTQREVIQDTASVPELQTDTALSACRAWPVGFLLSDETDPLATCGRLESGMIVDR